MFRRQAIDIQASCLRCYIITSGPLGCNGDRHGALAACSGCGRTSGLARGSRCWRSPSSWRCRSVTSTPSRRRLRRRSNPPSNCRRRTTSRIIIRMIFARFAPLWPWRAPSWRQRRRPCRSRKLSNSRIRQWMQRSSDRGLRAPRFNPAPLPSPDIDAE
jgi:hypothetical protein